MSVHQVAENTYALMCTVLLTSHQTSGDDFTSVTDRVTSPVAPENMRNELHSDPGSVLAAVYSVLRLCDTVHPEE